MPIHNSDVSRLLHRMADFLEIDGANQFRVRAYRNAARSVDGLSRNLANMVEQGEDLTQIKGVGRDLAEKIKEATSTGTLSKLQELEAKFPQDLVSLLELEGLGPKRVGTLYRELGVKNREELRRAARDGKIRGLSGFGAKSEKDILEAISRMDQAGPSRFFLSRVEEIVAALTSYLRRLDDVSRVEVAGSYRRRKETVGDLDVLVIAESGRQVMDHFVAFDDVDYILSKGETRASVVLRQGLQVDLRVVPESSFGAALHYFTGSKSHNISIRHLALQKGYKVNEYGISDKEQMVAGRREEDIYKALDLSYIEPEIREGQGEIEAAQRGELPRLVTQADIKGDLHVHSNYSDGQDDLKTLSEAALDRGYEYLAITDHSQRLRVAHGLDPKRLRRQIADIDRQNEATTGLTLLKGIEVDILKDGSLDLPDEVLAELDLTVCSVHSGFNLARGKQTERILKAMDNRYCTILGHPTGRLLGTRPPYELDFEHVVSAAADRGCLLELNSHPERLDIDDRHCMQAKQLGVKVVISTDAHSVDGLDLIRFGLDQARRGWLEKEDVANTKSLSGLLDLIRR